MATILASDMADLIALTLGDLGRMKFQQVYQDLQYFEVMSKWLKKDKVKFKNGSSVKENIMIGDADSSAEHVGYMDEDSVDIQDVMKTLSVDWKHVQTKWAVVYQTDILMNSGEAEIVDILKVRRAKALIDLAQEFENKAFGAVPATTNTTDPYGLKYWIVQNATTGFNGGNPGSYTSVGGLNPDVLSRWKNWTATYSGVITKLGAVKTMRKCKRQTGWKTPVTIPDYRGKMGQRYRLYCNETTLSEFEDVGEGQNESLGKDIASMDGQIVFRGAPIIWVPKLDADSNNPVYFVDHSTFRPVVLRGDYLREGKAKQNPNAHNVFQTFVDTSYQYLCDDRRRSGVIYQA